MGAIGRLRLVMIILEVFLDVTFYVLNIEQYSMHRIDAWEIVNRNIVFYFHCKMPSFIK